MERLVRRWRRMVYGEELVARLGSLPEGVGLYAEPGSHSRITFELVRVKGELCIRLDLGPVEQPGCIYISLRWAKALQSILDRALDRAQEASPDPDRGPAKLADR